MMTARLIHLAGTAVLSATLVVLIPAESAAQTARTRYNTAQTREQATRALLDEPGAGKNRALITKNARAAIAAYDALVRRYPISGYSDNALANAADLAAALYERFGDANDRETAMRFYQWLAAEYPASSLVRRTAPDLARLLAAQSSAPAVASASSQASPSGRARLTAIERTVLPDAVRITLSLDREVPYREETLNGPARVFFDLKGVEAAPELVDAVLRYPSDAVRQIRVGRHPNSTVRVVLDLEGVNRHSVYALYNPFRVVIDCEPAVASAARAAAAVPPVAGDIAPPVPAAPAPMVALAPPPVVAPAAPAVAHAIVREAEPEVPRVPAREAAPAAPPVEARATTPVAAASSPPEAANANRAGGFSLARQLGLGVSRIVIDPGHGGHDPGAQVKGLDEAKLTLDVALRLEALLQKEPGIEVVLTRRTDVYVPLEERTAIANREDADLFLSIHANASRNAAARGVETYFLSFAATPEAEAVAARENSAHAGEMRKLPDIIKAIALNTKLDESRDLAGMVQEALVTRLRRSNKNVRNLGVKKAPFVVLIGAGMPSVLAEVSFLTNRQELQLLKSATYKQRIAEALHAAVLRYRRSLKGQGTIASQ
jgi:N-acetylmuramoyl-L-alanine amidase